MPPTSPVCVRPGRPLRRLRLHLASVCDAFAHVLRGARRAVFVPGVAALAMVCIAASLPGCGGKKSIPGYGRPGVETSSPARPASPVCPDTPPYATAENLPEGWGFVDALCFEGVGEGRNEPDTLFGCLVHARDKGTGTVILPKGVYLGHVAEFITSTLKYYHIEEHFERFYGYRVVLVFRPATPEELEDRRNANDGARVGASFAGEAALTLFGAPLVPIVAPLVFAFEAVDEDLEFQRFKRNAKAQGLPEPTRRGDEITSQEYKDRYNRYWQSISGEDGIEGAEGEAAQQDVGMMYVVERCYLAHPRDGVVKLVAHAGDGE